MTQILNQSKHFILLALSLGFFMVIIDVTVVNVALPQIAKSLGGDVSWLQWVVDGYTLTFACLLLSVGNIADQLGTKKVFLWGLTLFVLTSIGCGLANTFWSLTLFRLAQGGAAALLVPTSLALLHSSYENKDERAKAIGIFVSIAGIAAAAGPIIGGILTTWFSWRAVFFVNVPIGIIAFLLTQKHVANPTVSGKNNFDFPGQIFSFITIAALAFALIEAGRLGWSSPLIISSFVIFCIALIIFLLIESRVNHPMLPLNLFRSPTFSVAIIVGMILNISMYGIFFILTLYFQQIRNYSVLATGFAFLPLLGVMTIVPYIGGKMTSMAGSRKTMLIGLTVGALGFFAMLIANQHISYVLLILPLMVMSYGYALTIPAVTFTTVHNAPEGKTGLASGVLSASRQLGSLIGVAIFGTIIAMTNHFISGMRITLFISGLAFLFGALITVLYVKELKSA
jgi:MFS transporter, DHA2 family, methylenomycin A resistance protein